MGEGQQDRQNQVDNFETQITEQFETIDDELYWEDTSSDKILSQLLQDIFDNDTEAFSNHLERLDQDINTHMQDQETLLHNACLYGRLEIFKLILGKNANVVVRDEDQTIPLHNACAGGFLEMVKILLQKAPNSVNSLDQDKETPLIIAANGGHYDIVKLLVEQGADINLRNVNSQSAVDVASENQEIFHYLRDLQEQQVKEASPQVNKKQKS